MDWGNTSCSKWKSSRQPDIPVYNSVSDTLANHGKTPCMQCNKNTLHQHQRIAPELNQTFPINGVYSAVSNIYMESCQALNLCKDEASSSAQFLSWQEDNKDLFPAISGNMPLFEAFMQADHRTALAMKDCVKPLSSH